MYPGRSESQRVGDMAVKLNAEVIEQAFESRGRVAYQACLNPEFEAKQVALPSPGAVEVLETVGVEFLWGCEFEGGGCRLVWPDFRIGPLDTGNGESHLAQLRAQELRQDRNCPLLVSFIQSNNSNRRRRASPTVGLVTPASCTQS